MENGRKEELKFLPECNAEIVEIYCGDEVDDMFDVHNGGRKNSVGRARASKNHKFMGTLVGDDKRSGHNIPKGKRCFCQRRGYRKRTEWWKQKNICGI